MGHFGIIGQCGKKCFNGVDETCFFPVARHRDSISFISWRPGHPPLTDWTEALSQGSDYRHWPAGMSALPRWEKCNGSFVRTDPRNIVHYLWLPWQRGTQEKRFRWPIPPSTLFIATPLANPTNGVNLHRHDFTPSITLLVVYVKTNGGPYRGNAQYIVYLVRKPPLNYNLQQNNKLLL